MTEAAEALSAAELESLPLIQQGKVRDIYAWDDDHLLIVTTDRISAFDVVLPQPIPGKGEVLNRCRRGSRAPRPPRAAPAGDVQPRRGRQCVRFPPG